ncbi:S-adenosyl-L-methionine-dependent methyltransferase [Diplogelasinospora grovesii]|uniref:S-adenosyl-L-methionine-dependent methyltransferase n=1 Tax=Diplogelasinospora grovesii TaxID=303347 RepID=A0AAN6NHG9_9PEZI|nr:S-adenosyl-L-methionine-dependent methyltransferase [Diplogelasinospora grovesii]
MSDIVAQIEALTKSPPQDPAERLALYNAMRKLSAAIEDPFDTIYRVHDSPMILIFSQVASDLGIFKKLSEVAPLQITGQLLAVQAEADPVLMSRILRFLASYSLIAETDEDTYKANNITHTLARPAFRAGISHGFNVILPCLQATPKFLADTKYQNPADMNNGPFQRGHNTTLPGFAYAAQHRELMDNFNLWMSETHDSQSTWLDVYNFAGHVKDTTPETLIFVDVGGGIGQQCALLKRTHPNIPGRVVLQDQNVVLEHALVSEKEGVETMAHNFWEEQPLKGARVYYMRNILHDYPDDKAVIIINNIVQAMNKDSVLVIDEMIIPNKGAHSRSTGTDMTMMAALAATERTDRQWDALLEKAGVRAAEKKTYNQATGASVVVLVAAN